MPNWCLNLLTVSGPKKELAKFINDHEIVPSDSFIMGIDPNNKKTTPLSLNAKVPEPKSVKDSYNWRIANWGCRHELDYQTSVDRADDNTVLYDFYTAWSPIDPWVKNVCGHYPKLSFHLHYEEPGMNFIGDAEAINGEFLGDNHREMTDGD